MALAGKEEQPVLPRIPLGDEPSETWERNKGAIVTGQALPLSVFLRLTPGETELFFALMLLKRYRQMESRLAKIPQIKGTRVAGMTVEEADRIRTEVAQDLEGTLHAWTPQYERGLKALKEATRKGYF